MFGAGALGRPRGMVRGRRREEGSGWGTHVHSWLIHVNVWQKKKKKKKHYNIVKYANIGSKETTGMTGKFGLGVQN